MQQLRDLQQNRSNEKNDDALLDRLTRLDADLNVAAEALVRDAKGSQLLTLQTALETQLQGFQAEQEHAKTTVTRARPDRDRKRNALEATRQQISAQLVVVDAADDNVFGAFCTKIGVQNIREYENVQLKMAKEEAEALADYSNQQARIKHQCVFCTIVLC